GTDVEVVAAVTFAAQCLDKDRRFAGRRLIARTPGRPGGEVDALQRRMQDVAESRAAEHRIERSAGIALGHRHVQRRVVGRRTWRTGGTALSLSGGSQAGWPAGTRWSSAIPPPHDFSSESTSPSIAPRGVVSRPLKLPVASQRP